MTDAIRLNEWRKLKYADPAEDLRRLRQLEISLAGKTVEPAVLALRTNLLKPDAQRRQAALFTYGVSEALGLKMYYAPVESSDYDFVTLTETPDAGVFTPVQLKELVPEDLNPVASLNNLLDGLTKYSSSRDLVVAVYLNRRVRLEFEQLRVPALSVAEVWLYGAMAEDQSRWLLYGNVLQDPRAYEFSYPT
jgi:hypothetical protein